MKKKQCEHVSRRSFIKGAAVAGGLTALGGVNANAAMQEETRLIPQVDDPNSVRTNVHVATGVPKTEISMPGPYPGIVSEVFHPGAVEGRTPDAAIVKEMLAEGMKSLTGEKDARDAWSQFINKDDRVGLKINPVGGRLVGTSLQMTQAVVAALEEIGLPRENMLFWEHYQIGLDQVGLTEENFPGIKIDTHHYMVEKDGEMVPGGLDRLDMDVYYEADYTLPDDQNEISYMLKGGEKSHFPKAITQDVDKIVNIPCMKHHGASFVVMALKNLAFGAVNNCVRGHFFIDRFISEICAFPPIRDKTVINILDGLRAQYDKGPSAQAAYIWNPQKIMVATDPVSLDYLGFKEIFAKRVEVGMNTADELEAFLEEYNFLAIAENLGLGVYRSKSIDHRITKLA